MNSSSSSLDGICKILNSYLFDLEGFEVIFVIDLLMEKCLFTPTSFIVVVVVAKERKSGEFRISNSYYFRC